MSSPGRGKRATPSRHGSAGAADRRGPGRPPSRPPAPPVEKKGRVASPRSDENRLEVVFDDPSCVKALFGYFKNLKAREIHIRCTPDALHFLTRDGTKKSRIVGSAVAERSAWFYCNGTFTLHLNRENTEKLFTSIDKSFYKLSFYQARDDQDNLHLLLNDAGCDSQMHYQITLSNFGEDEELLRALEIADLDDTTLAEQYPIEFTLDAKKFKKIVTDALSYSTTLSFEKPEGKTLQLSYTTASLTSTEVFTTPEKIRFRAGSDAPFGITAKLANLKPLASSMVADTVRVLCPSAGDLLFASELSDRALVIRTLTCRE